MCFFEIVWLRSLVPLKNIVVMLIEMIRAVITTRIDNAPQLRVLGGAPDLAFSGRADSPSRARKALATQQPGERTS